MKHFNEVLATLGATDIEVVQEAPDWDFWRAIYRTPVSNVEGSYLYLKHKCPIKEATADNLRKWNNFSRMGGYELVVTPRSPLAQNLDNTKSVFGASIARTTKQLLLDNFLRDFKCKPVIGDEYFIDPDLELQDGSNVNEATRFLLDWIKGTTKRPTSSLIAVLVANGGVGKTTVSRVLCDKLHIQDPSTIPILIESDQWQHLLQSTLTMETVWDLAISRRFEHASRLLANKTALRVLIREGLFVVMFDGFDELCISPGGAYSPKAILDELIELVTPEDEVVQARILLTARETFWESIEDDIDTSMLEVFRLKGFDNNKRKRYFGARLPDPAERDLAFRLSKQISGGIYDGIANEDINEDRPSGVPFILDLIARYVHDNPDVDMNPYKVDPFASLLKDVCRRENKRQSLNIDSETQFMIFEEVFREYPESVSLDELRFILEYFSSITDPSVVTRFTNHVFLVHRSKDFFGPRYEVLRVYFLARFLALGLDDITSKSKRGKIARLLAANSTGKTQVLEWLSLQLKQHDETKLYAAIHHAIDIIRDKENRDIQRSSSMALFHLAIKLVSATDKIERTNSLANLLNAETQDKKTFFQETTFTDQVRGFDFSQTEFIQCNFIDVEFKNCRFSHNCKFLSCTFEGTLTFINCDASNEIIVSDPTYSKEAEYAINKITNTSTREEIKTDFAEDALTRALKKFKGDYGFMSIQYQHRKTGFKPGNPYNEEVWEVLNNKKIVEKHEISGVDGGGLKIYDDKELRREIASFLDNGILGRRLRDAVAELIH